MNYMYTQKQSWNYRLVTIPIVAFTTIFFIWSYFAEIDESVKGSGKVIPSGQTRLIQHLEGGIITHIFVNEGDTVQKGDVLFRIENQYFISEKKENSIKLIALRAKSNRIDALLNNLEAPQFDKEMIATIPQIVQNEREVFREQRSKYSSQISVLNSQLHQKHADLKELQVRLENLTLEYNLTLENMKIQEELANKKIISREKFIQHQSAKQKIYTQLEEARFKIPIINREIEEWKKKIEGKSFEIRTELFEESSEIQVEIQKLQEAIKTYIDRDKRMDVLSPTKGIINKLYYNTIGGIVRSGETIAEVSPIDDDLMIEAKINSSDRAYIHPKQDVSIEITAYDYSKYGLLDGKLISISPDSTTDELGNNYYTIKVRADNYRFDENSPILIGMSANVNILTGKRTVLYYLLKPIKNIKYKALKEH
ncbi:MAG: HlyD family type I secretion periplasmic adaptor subunit [Sulfurimonas sp.]